MAVIHRDKVKERSPARLLMQMEDIAGQLIISDDIESISVTVTNMKTGSEVGSFSPHVLSCIHDEMQDWDEDEVGYNCSIDVPGEYFPTGDTTYQIDILFTPNDDEYANGGDPWYEIWQLDCANVYAGES